MKPRLAAILAIVTILLLATSCHKQSRQYVVGVSQCSHDIWREKQNAELRMGTYFRDDVELRFAAAYDSDERQVQQIDSLVATGIDLLIVAPNQVATISPAIDRAFDKGIPVIVFERKTNSRKYTAYIGADNYEMGRLMGEYMATRLHGKGRVIEIMGLQGSSPAIERHNGFTDAMKGYPQIEIVATLQGDWTEESAVKAVNDYEGDFGHLDFVFGQNDRMAMGARKALIASGHISPSTKFCGIDGLPGDGGGIQLVRDSILDATYLYPTHGDQLLNLAIDILEGKPYKKESLMMSAIVTHDNANVLLMESEEIMRKAEYLEQLHQVANGYLHQLDVQRIATMLACGVIVLLLMVIVLLYLYHRRKVIIQRERVVNNLWNMEQPAHTPTAEQVTATHLLAQSEDGDEPATETDDNSEEEQSPLLEGRDSSGLFIARFKEVVEKRLDDSNLSVEDLAAEMNLSRVQLYRKVKAVTSSSPVELLRSARLNRGYQLLLTSDKTVSEVAYAVGFTAPSYFTKCFKDEFGHSPTDMKGNG